ncbi:MAG: hypothetical protein ACRERV_02710 [Methylococcales bacterium]
MSSEQRQIEQFIVTLQQDAIFSEHAASTGGHECLDYLPGAAFLGAVAARLYEQYPDRQLDYFHNGKVRFHDALPIGSKGFCLYPIPLCWHYAKEKEAGEEYINLQHLDSKDIEDYYAETQWKQYRNHYVNLYAKEEDNNCLFQTQSDLRMKTAIDFESGTAAQQQLFGYASLPKGSRFLFQLEAETGVDLSPILEVLRQGIRLGRSRSAEYGAVELSKVPYVLQYRLPVINEDTDSLSLWLLSDTALQDACGQPTLQPSAVDIGLPNDLNLELQLERSFIRSRYYAPFNNKHQCRDLERTVLSRGSVLYFQSTKGSAIDARTLQTLQDRGIGLYRQNGLGRVWINAPILKEMEVRLPLSSRKLQSYSSLIRTSRVVEEPTENPLYRYLQSRIGQQKNEDTIGNIISEWRQKLVEAYRSALRLEPYSAGLCIGPSPTQWGRVMEAATQPNRLFGQAKKRKPEGSQAQEDKDEIQTESPSLLNVSWGFLHSREDVPVEGLQPHIADWKDEVIQDALQTIPIKRDHVKLNHRGASDAAKQSKFDRVSLTKGHRFSVELSLWGTLDDEMLWNKVLALLKRPDFRLGGGTRRGLGKLDLIRCHQGCFKLGETDARNGACELARFSRLGTSLADTRELGTEPLPAASHNLESIILHLQPETEGYRFGGGNEPLGQSADEQNAPDLMPVTERVVSWNPTGSIKQRQLVIPESSIKGAFSHRTAYHYNRLSGRYSDKQPGEPADAYQKRMQDYLDQNLAVRNLFGYVDSKQHPESAACILRYAPMY